MTPRRTTATPRPHGRQRGRPRDVDRAARRDALLETAMRLFLVRGYGGTTIDLVAAEAQVAKRTIYSTVGDKADLFVAVIRRLGDRVVNPTDADPGPDLHGFGVRLVRLMLSDEAVGLHRLVISEATTFPDLAARLYANGARRYIETLRAMLAELPDNRFAVPPGDLETLAATLFTVFLGEAHRRRLFGLDPAPADDDVNASVTEALGRFLVPDATEQPPLSGPSWRSSSPP